MQDSGVSVQLAFQPKRGDSAAVTIDPVGHRVLGCAEWTEYLISAKGSDLVRVVVDEVELLCGPGANNWEWRAGFFAGEVPLEILDDGGKLLASYRIDVSPSPGKLGSAAYASMVDAIFEFDPRLLLGPEAAQTTIGVEGTFRDPHLAYARLRLHGPSFVSALAHIRLRPQTRLHFERERVPIHRVRRMDSVTVRTALRNPSTADVLRGHAALSAQGSSLFDVPAAIHGVDNPANRTILAVVLSVLRRVRAVRTSLGELAARENDEGRALAERMPRRLQFLSGFETSLRRAVSSIPFSEVRRPEISAAGLNTVSAHPAYARAYQSGWKALRSGIAGQRGDESLWMSPTWQTYERWCFLRVVQALRQLLPGSTSAIHYPSLRGDCIAFKCSAERIQVHAYLQARFPAHDQTAWRGFRSISAERYPDIVVTSETPADKKFVVLDAKYRVSRSGVLEGMESAHIYRDSLRWMGRNPDLALLLVPAPGGAAWLEDQAFWDEHAVGVLPVSVGRGSQELESVLRHYLAFQP